MLMRVPASPEVLNWAISRAGWTGDVVHERFPRLSAWIEGDDTPPTMKQLQAFAHAAHVPLGYLFLAEPPAEEVPIPDFRTRQNAEIDDVSPDLRDTIYLCQRRQAWYRDFAVARGMDAVQLVGAASVGDPIEPTADLIRASIGFGLDRRASFKSWEAAFRQLIDLIETAGVLVSVNGIVGSDTHRALDPEEFGGFALVDDFAPLIFVNGADTKAAQIFTIVHELAHIVAGESALSDSGVSRATNNASEIWCNQIAAEVLVPGSALHDLYAGEPTEVELNRLASAYRVSTLVVLTRLHEIGLLEWDEYRQRYGEELKRVREKAALRKEGPGGGNYYFVQPLRLGRRFARAVVLDARQGRTTYGDAYRLLGTAKPETFTKLATELGVA